MISSYHALCWRGRHAIRIERLGQDRFVRAKQATGAVRCAVDNWCEREAHYISLT
jgi:hypothetical protein